jgi:hypothetical protein
MIKRARTQHMVGARPLTQAMLGRMIGCSQGKIQKMEAGNSEFFAADIDKIIEVLHLEFDVAAKMRVLVHSSRFIDPWSGDRTHVPAYARRMIDSEKDATEVLAWHEARIPGTLQSDHHMLAQFQVGGQIDVAPYYRNRKQRRELFTRPQLQRYACVLGEESLHRAYASLGRGPALDQIDFLIRLVDPGERCDFADHRTTVSLLPMDASVPYLPNDFMLIRLPEAGHSFVYMENVCGADYHNGRDALEKAETAFSTLLEAALGVDETVFQLRALRKKLAGR